MGKGESGGLAKRCLHRKPFLSCGKRERGTSRGSGRSSKKEGRGEEITRGEAFGHWKD